MPIAAIFGFGSDEEGLVLSNGAMRSRISEAATGADRNFNAILEAQSRHVLPADLTLHIEGGQQRLLRPEATNVTLDVLESNSDPVTSRTGTVSPSGGGSFTVLGVASAGVSSGHLGTALQGIYGTLTIAADGTYLYRLDNADADTNLIGAGQVGHDRFTYTYQQNGQIQTGEVLVNVAGVEEPGQVVTNYTSTVTVPGSLVIGTLERLVFAAENSITGLVNDLADPGVSDLINNGSIVVGTPTGPSGIGIYGGDGYRHPEGGKVLLVNNGRVEVMAGAAGATALGITSSGVLPLVNNGVISALSANSNAAGIAANWQVINTGLIEVIAPHGYATGVNDSRLVNSGTIYVAGGLSGNDGAGNPGEFASTGVVGYGMFCAINNSGTIHAVSTNSAFKSIGISLFPNSSNPYSSASIFNSGRIVADVAIQALEGYNISLAVINTGHIEGDFRRDQGLDVVFNDISGDWIGNFTFGRDANLFLNAGLVTGNIVLAAGSDVFDSSGGTLVGTVDGGTGSDLLIGGAGAQTLLGGEGNDILSGGAGADQLTGGTGSDIFLYVAGDSTDAARDMIIDFEHGVDRLDLGRLAPTSVSFATSNGVTIVSGQGLGGAFSIAATGTVTLSDLILTLPGNELVGGASADLLYATAASSTLSGNGGADMLVGSAGNDRLDGGTGADTMFGGLGNDVYIVDDAGDRLLEGPDGGVDEVLSFVGYTLQAFVENGTLIGDASVYLGGNNLDNLLAGNNGNNELDALDGNDTLYGAGGADLLHGGLGADRFLYLDPSDSTAGATDYLEYFEHGLDWIDLRAVSPTTFAFDEFGNPSLGTHWTNVTIATASGATMAIRIGGKATIADFVVQGSSDNVHNDFNGDGRSDILWRSDSGGLSDWLAKTNGGFTDNGAASFTHVPTDWHVAGTGDFNGDGRSDILWRSDSGGLSDWLGKPNGGFTDNGAASFTTVSNDWHVAGTGDFNGDGRDDILWRSDNGAMSNWLGNANGGFTDNGSASFTTVSTDWYVAGTGDFNGDGRDDILWRSDGGALSNWLGTANGGFTDNGSASFGQVSTDWHIQPHDYMVI